MMVMGPLLVGIALSILFSETFTDVVPENLNTTQWSELSSVLQTDFRIRNRNGAAVVLVIAHTLQLYFCLPMEHVTKILYGYWLGFWRGYITCVCWELSLYCAYVQRVERLEQTNILKYVQEKRRNGTLLCELMLCCMSILPLHTKILILKFSDVTCREFMGAYTLTTMVLSLKSVLVGSLIISNPSHTMMGVMFVMMAVAFVIPLMSTLVFSSRIFHVLQGISTPEYDMASRSHSTRVVTRHKRKLRKYRSKLGTIFETEEVDYDVDDDCDRNEDRLLLCDEDRCDDIQIEINDAEDAHNDSEVLATLNIQDEYTYRAVEMSCVPVHTVSFEKTSCMAYCEKYPPCATIIDD